LANNVGNRQIYIHKDIIAPSITINSPISYQLFSAIPPTYNLSIDSLYTNIWYNFDDGINYTASISGYGSIDRSVWENLDDGTVKLTFYAKDDLNNVGNSSINIIRDSTSIVITIIEPEENDIYDENPPKYNLTIIGDDMNTAYYIINGTQINFLSLNGTINNELWESLEDGNVTINFYIRDKAGNLGSENVLIYKDTTFPVFSIIKPKNNSSKK